METHFVYHGTNEKFNKFSFKKVGSSWGVNFGGFYFTDNLNVAKQYAKGSGLGTPIVNECLVVFKNPLILDIKEVNCHNKFTFAKKEYILKKDYENVVDTILINSLVNKLQKSRYYNKDEYYYKRYYKKYGVTVKSKCRDFIKHILKENNYDGIIIKNCCDAPVPNKEQILSDIYIALKVSQIKIVNRIALDK